MAELARVECADAQYAIQSGYPVFSNDSIYLEWKCGTGGDGELFLVCLCLWAGGLAAVSLGFEWGYLDLVSPLF